MKVFLSWSGDKSKALGNALRNWLPLNVNSLEPWLSDRDISPGSHWAETLFKRLAESKLGLICVTSENMESPWLLFETGAMTVSGRVIPLLFDLPESAKLSGPLSVFQSIRVNKDKIIGLVDELLHHSAPGMTEKQRSELFEVTWPLLETRLNSIRKAFDSHNTSETEASIERDVLIGDAVEPLVAGYNTAAKKPAPHKGEMKTRIYIGGKLVDFPNIDRDAGILELQNSFLQSELAYLKRQGKMLKNNEGACFMINNAISKKEHEASNIKAAIGNLAYNFKTV